MTPLPAIIGKRPTNNTRSNLLESVIRRPKKGSDDEEEEFDLMKQARQAINQRNASDRVVAA